MRIAEVLDLEQIDDALYRGQAVESLLTRTFGGQVAAQALAAAMRTVDEVKAVHSLHAYFVAPGASSEPTVYQVETIREGTSFAQRHVRAFQHGGTIFTMQASFHRRTDDGPEHSEPMPAMPDPESLPPSSELPLSPTMKALLEEWREWDLRLLPPEGAQREGDTGRRVVWFRSRPRLPDDPAFHVATLAYMSDMTLLTTALETHPEAKVQCASLDHAMWFLREFRADEWLLYDQVSPSAHGGRALTQGRIFDRAGALVTVVTQEGLVRTLRPRVGAAAAERGE